MITGPTTEDILRSELGRFELIASELSNENIKELIFDTCNAAEIALDCGNVTKADQLIDEIIDAIRLQLN